MKHKKILLIILALIVINIYFLFSVIFNKPIENKMKVIFFDVGQGDASLIMAENGANILIDGGQDKTVINKLDKYIPLWNRKLDIVVLTHPHSDHVSGLADVLKKYPVGEVWMTGVLQNTPEYIEFLKIIRDKKIGVKIVWAAAVHGTKDIFKNTKIEILYPNKNLFQQSVDNLNNSSIVLKISYKNKSFLFAGDIEKEVEDELRGQPPLNSLPVASSGQALKGDGILEADVLKIAHHGSDTSSSDSFFERVKPSFAVISLGANNDFGMPSLRVLKRLERIGAKVYRTDIDGDIIMESDGSEISKVWTSVVTAH